MSRAQANADRLIDNSRATVHRFDFEVGAETGFHVHGFDYVIAAITDCNMRIEDETGSREVFVKAGDAYWREKGVAHNVINAGDTPMSFVEIELK